MAGDDDNDKTVFGQPLPQVPRPQGQGAHPPQHPPQHPPAGGGAGGADRTVFGQPLPPAGAAPGRSAPGAPPSQYQPPPAQPPQPWNNPGADDTWLGGALNPYPGQPQPPAQPPAQPPGQNWPAQPPVPPQSGAPPPQQYQPPPQQAPLYQPGTGQRPAGAQFFPEIPREQVQTPRASTPRIALSDALRATGLGAGGSTNPLIASAVNLLILLGRLRTGLVEMQAGPLIDHVTREIDDFERNALAAGVSSQDASDAKYALSATADDIVQNLPGADRGMWMEYSMVARFFGERSSGVGFFQKMDEAMRAPGQRFNLLELMLTCLSLGFEGQYRTMPNGSVELARIRTAIYETLRRVQPRPDDDISVKWTAVPLGGKARRGGTQIWVMGAVAAMMVVALFATLSTLLTRQSTTISDGIISLHSGQPPIVIERSEPVVQPYQAPDSSQLERLREALAPQIEAGEVEVERNNEWVFVRVGEYLRFGSGSADLTSDFTELAGAIGQALDREIGPIRVVGHTDSIPPSGRGRYKTNEQLSVARAQTVGDILSGAVSEAARVSVEGKGAVDPIADNETRDGRARNRRVEIMIPRED